MNEFWGQLAICLSSRKYNKTCLLIKMYRNAFRLKQTWNVFERDPKSLPRPMGWNVVRGMKRSYDDSYLADFQGLIDFGTALELKPPRLVSVRPQKMSSEHFDRFHLLSTNTAFTHTHTHTPARSHTGTFTHRHIHTPAHSHTGTFTLSVRPSLPLRVYFLMRLAYWRRT